MICREDQTKIDHWVQKFPEPKGAVLMALRILQDRHGWLSDESLDAVAEYLGIEKVDVYEVVSFYSMYRRQPGGKHYLKICTSLSCCLTGAYDVIAQIESQLNISLGQTTSDGQVTLQETECLGACQGAPVGIVNDVDYHEHLTPKSVDQLLETLQQEVEHE
ncbi:NADH-quinone oxidoreductase subunit NuoE [Candidatus Synchoanobacter obligatus]|uniref:NADH-quinone oxidoreductase subunit E n=1 Tax=Candidatus Synchoanobacter obligatus TaxID=2919597 RepID=A0ABT1L470_9GAMM|nr:NADH-quinone oxidoreductase subunit NuoE [Candidatus Synchoanobacter obligatus]MCP8351969.1 NADH-quinone oxidoreductase subunit NuoE [Candidatus Synchoanobacter obligatus]